MEIASQFTVCLTLLLIFFVLVMLAIAVFCSVVRKIENKKDISPRLKKWVEVLDWLKEEDNE